MHENKFPSKGADLVKRWEAFQENQKKLQELKKAEAAKPKPTDASVFDEPTKSTGASVEEVKGDAPVEESKEPAAKKSIGEQVTEFASKNPLPAHENIDKNISTFNGAANKKYNWSQGTLNVDVQIKLPAGTKARQVICDIKTNHLKVIIKGSEEPIIDG